MSTDAARQYDQDLIYEPGVPAENRMHVIFAFEDLVLPLQRYFERVGFRAW